MVSTEVKNDFITVVAGIFVFLGLQQYLSEYIILYPWIFIGSGITLMVIKKKLI